ncbi:hypothetical protein CCR75_009388 [Bremia lactucae]|uniref:Uncharacterized protein n=1 Tax=Bremia lactucae TaxID=4779 RepID=A0A976FN83_BRELC|nr:hypothetical protein CCR75_009388 [Bremia lactucae]
MRRALTKHDEADALGIQLQENQYEKICCLNEDYGVFSNLIPENIEAVTLVANFLLHCGSEEQMSYFLPDLANGIELHCCNLTGPSSGSDADYMRYTGSTQLQENQYEKICGLKEDCGVFSNLIPENIEAVTLVANVTQYNRKIECDIGFQAPLFLLHYESEEQISYFLPDLANGIELHCCNLTGPSSGSDADYMRYTGSTQLQENQYEKICGLKEDYGVFSNLIPENIEAVTLVANVTQYNRKIECDIGFQAPLVRRYFLR